MRIVSWNIRRQSECWHALRGMNADIALVQEATSPPAELGIKTDEGEWRTAGSKWRAAVAAINPDMAAAFAPLAPAAIDAAKDGQLRVSRMGTLAAADVVLPGTANRITVASMYGYWEAPRSEAKSPWIYADASVHRLISDLSYLIDRQRGHAIIAAGDLNILRGYGENGSEHWKRRYATVFDRFEALGMVYAGPQLDEGAPLPERPNECPADSRTIPTFRTRQKDPKSATRQLDFVFVSADLASRVRTRALCGDEEWGPSDHCRVLIELE